MAKFDIESAYKIKATCAPSRQTTAGHVLKDQTCIDTVFPSGLRSRSAPLIFIAVADTVQ